MEKVLPLKMEETGVKELIREVLHVDLPWFVEGISVNTKVGVVEVGISYHRGSEFKCCECEKNCKVHDSSEKSIRHLDLFEYRCYLRVKVPRTICKVHGIRTIDSLPFCRSGSHYSFF